MNKAKPKFISAPSIARHLKNTMNSVDMWHALEKEGLKGSLKLPDGNIVKYEYDPDDKEVKAHMLVNWTQEKAVLDECKRMRDEEKKLSTADAKGINGFMFKITPYLDVSLRYMGIDHYKADWDGDMYAAMLKAIETQFPAYKTTNRKLI